MKTIEVELFCDEIKEQKLTDDFGNIEKWIYIGVLIVPSTYKKSLLSTLINLRCGANPAAADFYKCDKHCRFHEKNNKEVHYQALRSSYICSIGNRWINFLLNDKSLSYYYVLGINLTNLDYKKFGNSSGYKKFAVIYNRFFRMAVLKALKSYFTMYDRIIVDKIYHDTTDLSETEYFDWHCIYKLENDEEKIFFNNNKIESIDSDHNISEDANSHLIQYIDLLLGLTFNAFHSTSNYQNKDKLTLRYMDLLKRVVENPNNKNSSYNYFKRIAVDFFPKSQIFDYGKFDIEITRFDSFYKKRSFRILDIEQPFLPFSEGVVN